MNKKALLPKLSLSHDRSEAAPLPKEPWDDSSNRPATEEPQVYWKNIGYLGETKDFASHSYSASEPAPQAAPVGGDTA